MFCRGTLTRVNQYGDTPPMLMVNPEQSQSPMGFINRYQYKSHSTTSILDLLDNTCTHLITVHSQRASKAIADLVMVQIPLEDSSLIDTLKPDHVGFFVYNGYTDLLKKHPRFRVSPLSLGYFHGFDL